MHTETFKNDKMKKKVFLSGGDYFIYALDRNIRSAGLSGNLNVVLLELDAQLDRESFLGVIKEVFGKLPALSARFGSILGLAYFWHYDSSAGRQEGLLPELNTHCTDAPTPEKIVKEILNTPLDKKNGSLIRFDIINCKNRYFLCITLEHILMDVQGVRQFLSLLSNAANGRNAPAQQANDRQEPRWRDSKRTFIGKLKLIRTAMKSLDSFALKSRPFSMYHYRSNELGDNRFNARYVSFTEKESLAIAELSEKKCGYLNETTHFLLVVLKEMDRLYKKLRFDPGSFVFPVIMHLGRKRDDTMYLGNNITFLYYQILKEEITAGDKAVVASLRKQLVYQLENETDIGAYYGLRYLRCLPIRIYQKKMYQSLKGEIGTFLHSNIGNFSLGESSFLNCRVINIFHFPTVCVPPGIAFTFSSFNNILSYSIVYVEKLFRDEEVDSLVEGINNRLISG